MRKPPTGEPYAGKPPARFGGRGGREPIPTPIHDAHAPLPSPRPHGERATIMLSSRSMIVGEGRPHAQYPLFLRFPGCPPAKARVHVRDFAPTHHCHARTWSEHPLRITRRPVVLAVTRSTQTVVIGLSRARRCVGDMGARTKSEHDSRGGRTNGAPLQTSSSPTLSPLASPGAARQRETRGLAAPMGSTGAPVCSSRHADPGHRRASRVNSGNATGEGRATPAPSRCTHVPSPRPHGERATIKLSIAKHDRG